MNTMGGHVSISRDSGLKKAVFSVRSPFYTTCSCKWVTYFLWKVLLNRDVTGRRASSADCECSLSDHWVAVCCQVQQIPSGDGRIPIGMSSERHGEAQPQDAHIQKEGL